MGRRAIDLTGRVFGKLTVIQRAENASDGNLRWTCECECGGRKDIRGADLKRGHTMSCGCLPTGTRGPRPELIKDRVGQRFGQLLVLELAPRRADGKTRWVCRCDCGNVTERDGSQMVAGKTISCGCRQLITSRTHGMTHTTEFNIWQGMKNRCTRPSHKSYADYGGRGITVHWLWMTDFMAFYRHVGPRPGPEYSIDRIDNQGNYEPGNVRWATAKEQGANRRPRLREAA